MYEQTYHLMSSILMLNFNDFPVQLSPIFEFIPIKFEVIEILLMKKCHHITNIVNVAIIPLHNLSFGISIFKMNMTALTNITSVQNSSCIIMMCKLLGLVFSQENKNYMYLLAVYTKCLSVMVM